MLSRSAAGFTIIELLIALTVGAIVLTAARAAFSTAVDTQRRASRVVTDVQTWRFFSTRLRRDLQNLLFSEGHGFQGDTEWVSFVSDLGTDGILPIRYRYARTPAGAQIRRRAGDNEAPETVVYEGVSAVQFSYLLGKTWSQRTTGDLPGVVACRVSGASGQREVLVALELARSDD